MKQHLHKRDPLLLDEISPSENKTKKQINCLIQSLVKRRKYHEARIDQLIGPSYPSRDATQESIKHGQGSEFSQLLERLDHNEAIQTDRGQGTAGAFGSHVNLLATVSLKTQYFLSEKLEKKQHGRLFSSLIHQFENCKVSKAFIIEPSSKQLQQSLKQVIEYLKDEQMQCQLLTQSESIQEKQLEYNGTRFSMGKYEEVHLSKQALRQEEIEILCLRKQEQQTILQVGWVLLRRLLSQTDNSTFPHILHTLFSYPIKTFQIGESLQLIEFNELLKDMAKIQQEKAKQDESPLKIFGIEERNCYAYEIQNLSKSKSIKNYIPILNRFKRLVLIHQQQLPVKHIPLSCLQNHFVVVSLSILTKGQYFISVGSANLDKRFRIYVLDFQGNAIQSNIIRNAEFIYCKLQQAEYQVYINPIPLDQTNCKEMEASYDLVSENQENFNLWIQGKEVYSKNGEVNLEIRLKEEYNHYTNRIAQQYLNHIHSKKAIEQVSHPSNSEVIIHRSIISGLYLVQDTFLCEHKTPITIKYKGTSILADHLFQQTSATLTAGQSITLYTAGQIQSITLESKPNPQALEFSIVQSYI